MKYTRNTPISMKVMEMPPFERPREKMEEKGSEALSDLELLSVLISAGTPTRPVFDIASDLLVLLDKKPDASLSDMAQIRGMGKAKSTQIAAALELGRRRTRKSGTAITSPRDIFYEVRHYAYRSQEQFIVLTLNGAHEVIDIFTATIGLVNKTLIHPREVFSEPLKRRATSIAIAHNHPSGQLVPSEEDINVTNRLVESGKLLGIKVLDHIIFSKDGYYSFLEHSLL
ncbi:MAG: DNA repair protein RadC [Sphaerochaetaceae bacterium]|nr:DNA repair protein RadC [Sphaerochaetaceae bacterium]